MYCRPAGILRNFIFVHTRAKVSLRFFVVAGVVPCRDACVLPSLDECRRRSRSETSPTYPAFPTIPLCVINKFLASPTSAPQSTANASQTAHSPLAAREKLIMKLSCLNACSRAPVRALGVPSPARGARCVHVRAVNGTYNHIVPNMPYIQDVLEVFPDEGVANMDEAMVRAWDCRGGAVHPSGGWRRCRRPPTALRRIAHIATLSAVARAC